MILREGIRKALALMGCGLWMLSSICPLFGGGAKVEATCHGDVECVWEVAGDYLPLLEMVAPIAALLLLYPFARFAFSVFAPKPEDRQKKWRLASDQVDPVLSLVARVGCVWGVWRAVLYPLDLVTAPYIALWLSFAIWFALGAWISARSSRDWSRARD